MKILISGATGFVGRNLTQSLIEDSYEVTIICRKSSQIDESIKKQCRIIYYDQNDLSEFKRQVLEAGPEYVIHLATCFLSKHTITDISELIQANIIFGTHLLEALSELPLKKFINTTTYATSVNGQNYDPQNLYTASKKSFEDILYYYYLAKELPVINLALYDTYGPNDSRPKLINLILNSTLKNETLNMSPGKQEICYTYIDDVVEAFKLTLNLETKKGWINYSVHAKEVFSLEALTQEIGRAIDKTCKVNLGFYEYRPREIMKFAPQYPPLPNFVAKTSISQGVNNILKET